MSGLYSPKQFFRKVSNKYLIDYLEQKNIEFDLDLSSISDNDADLIFNAFIELERSIRHEMEPDFQRIHALATDGGIIALTEEANEHNNFDFIESIRSISGLHNKAMWAFLNGPTYWQAASMFFQANGVRSSSWKTIQNLPVLQKPFEEIEIELLSSAIGDYFFNKEGRGKRCKVEHYKRGKFDYFYAFPEDFAKNEVEWKSNKLQDTPHTMAFEIIFIYCQEEATLALYAKNNAKNIPQLQKLFVEYILKDKLRCFTRMIENKVYQLEELVEPNFDFVIPAGSGVYSVKIIQASATKKLDLKSEIIVKSCPDKNRNAVHEQLAELKLSDRYISQVVLLAILSPSKGKGLRQKKIIITTPDKCNLGLYADDLILRQMLIASGIEPQPVNFSLSCM